MVLTLTLIKTNMYKSLERSFEFYENFLQHELMGLRVLSRYICFYLFEKPREIKIIFLLVRSSNACKNWAWANIKIAVRKLSCDSHLSNSNQALEPSLDVFSSHSHCCCMWLWLLFMEFHVHYGALFNARTLMDIEF